MDSSNFVAGLALALIAAVVYIFQNYINTGQQTVPGGDGSPGASPEPETGGGGFFDGSFWGTDPALNFSDLEAPDNVRQWTSLAKNWADLRGLPWQIVLAVIWVESGGNPNAVGSADEQGLMQLKQIAVDDARQAGYQVPFDWFTDPESNIAGGTAYLALQKQRTGNIKTALKAYNQGYAGMNENPGLAETYKNKVVTRARKLGWWG